MSEFSPLMEETLENGGEVIFTVTGNSMAPLLYHRRDKVCIVKPNDKVLKKYDIPLFVRRDGKYILHRIVAIRENGYVTMGDNQCIKEYPVLPIQVIGVVKGFWRRGEYVSCDNFWYKIYCRLCFFRYSIRWMNLKGKQIFVTFRKLRGGEKESEG